MYQVFERREGSGNVPELELCVRGQEALVVGWTAEGLFTAGLVGLSAFFLCVRRGR